MRRVACCDRETSRGFVVDDRSRRHWKEMGTHMTDVANTIETLRALVVATWSFLSPTAGQSPDAPAIADAIATAVAGDPDPIYGDASVEAAVAAVYAWHESRLRIHPVPWVDPSTGKPVDGLAHGIFQLHTHAGELDATTQTVAWLAMLHDGARTCPASPAAPLSGGCTQARKLADRRMAFAVRVVGQREVH